MTLSLDAHRLGLLSCAASIAILTACGGSAPSEPDPEPPEVTGTLVAETLELEDGGTLPYDRGVIQVPIRRADASTATLDLEFFRFHRSTDASPDVPPVFQLRGGPGFGGLGPQLDDPGYYEHLLERYTRASDLVVVGQRGFGSSTATPCEPARALTVEEALDDDVRKQARFEAGQACRRHWEEQGLDLQGFTVVEAADDVIDVAEFLGYDTIQLWGVSFGSHWGMTVLRRHPDRVARATFSGLEGPDHTYDMPSGVLGAMEQIAASAEAETTLGLPTEGLLAAYSKAIEAFDADPVSLTVALDPDEVDGIDAPQTVELQLDGSHLREMLAGSRRFTAFRHRSLRWPGALHAIVDGQVDVAARMWIEAQLDRDLPDAAFFMLDCSSGISQVRGEILRNDPAAALLGPLWLGYDEGCAPWDADLGEAFRQPFESAVPTVLVQGNWDTSTPYENAVEARELFEHHRFIHVEGGSHGALREAIEEVEGFEAAILQWLATGDFEPLPEHVELPPMDWAPRADD